MVGPALVTLHCQDVQQELQGVLRLEGLFDCDLTEEVNASVGNKSLTTFLGGHNRHNNLVGVVDQQQVVFKYRIVGVSDDVEELGEVEEDGGVGHDLLVRHETGEDGEGHGLVHPGGAAVRGVFTPQHPG